jgi:tmRNA-binding protein
MPLTQEELAKLIQLIHQQRVTIIPLKTFTDDPVIFVHLDTILNDSETIFDIAAGKHSQPSQ